MTGCVVGIDTSCYTTSVALLDDKGRLLADARRLLSVKPGGRGLAQSEMVFQHTRNLPDVFAEAMSCLSQSVCFTGIGVSAFPRNLPDSYMPAFLVGDGYARVLAVSHGIPLYRISHQENHIFAGLWSAQGPNVPEFLAVHISGGTSEIVRVRYEQDISITCLGGSLDLHAGQFVDRIGVALQLPFPAGPHVERLARDGRDNVIELPVSVKECNMSFSGPETQAMRCIAQGVSPHAIAAGVEACISRTVAKAIEFAVRKTGLHQVLIVGGVMSNQYIRTTMRESLDKINAELYFPDNRFSPDNAVGAAYFAFTRLNQDIL